MATKNYKSLLRKATHLILLELETPAKNIQRNALRYTDEGDIQFELIADITIPYSEEIYSLWLREIYEELYLFYAKGTGKEDNFGNEEDAMFFYVTKNSAGFETIAEGLEESCTIDLKSPTFAFKQNFLALLRQLILSKEYEPAK